MNLYKAKWQRANSIDVWMHTEFVVAENFNQVSEYYPQTESIDIVEKGIKILPIKK